jgi:hypothetical protein
MRRACALQGSAEAGNEAFWALALRLLPLPLAALLARPHTHTHTCLSPLDAQAGRTSSTMRMVRGVVEYSAGRLQQDWRLVGGRWEPGCC